MFLGNESLFQSRLQWKSQQDQPSWLEREGNGDRDYPKAMWRLDRPGYHRRAYRGVSLETTFSEANDSRQKLSALIEASLVKVDHVDNERAIICASKTVCAIRVPAIEC